MDFDDLAIKNHVYFFKNNKGRDFFVGDIHGEYHKLMSLLEQVNFDFANDRLFATGDLIDRGEYSLDCLKLSSQDWFFSVLGNHEQFLLEAESFDLYKKMIWQKNGGGWFEELSDADKKLAKQLIKDNLSLSLTVNTVRGDIGIIHAEYPFHSWPIKEGIKLDKDSYRKMLWGRDIVKTRLENYTSGIELLFSGHTVVETPLLLGNQVFLDTGCGYTLKESIYPPRLTICEVTAKALKFYSNDKAIDEIPF